jgi:hypothetical protein
MDITFEYIMNDDNTTPSDYTVAGSGLVGNLYCKNILTNFQPLLVSIF